VKPKSAKRRAADRRRRRVVADLLATRGVWCQARVPGVCSGRATDAHEVISRARGGDPTDADNIRLICRACHDWVHDHPVEATELGLSARPDVT